MEKLRQKIKKVDSTLLELISSRINLAKEIGIEKRKLNMPVKNFQVEKKVISRIRKRAIELDLNADFAETIMQKLINEAVSVQLNLPKVNNQLIAKRCLVIGGLGKMGNWFVNYLRSSGHQALISDPKSDNIREQDLPHNLDGFDIIIIATPMVGQNELFEKLIKQKPRGLIFDISSLKSNLLQITKKGVKEGLLISSCHPMFGPNVSGLNGRNIIICSAGSDEADKMLVNLFKDTAARLTFVEIEDHDRYALFTLGLAHQINLIMGAVLSRSKIPFDKLMKFAGTTFLKQISTTKEVFNEDPNLYHSIQYLNSYKEELFNSIKVSSLDIANFSNRPDPMDFIEMMTLGRGYFNSKMNFE